MKRSDFSSVDR